MLSSGLRKVMKALLILLAAAWITTGANATTEGERAPDLADKRFVSTYLYAAVRPATATDDAFALVLPEVNANTMDVFIDRFAACLAQNTHAVVLLDQAGARGAGGRSHPQHQKRAYFSSSGGFFKSCLEPKEVIE